MSRPRFAIPPPEPNPEELDGSANPLHVSRQCTLIQLVSRVTVSDADSAKLW